MVDIPVNELHAMSEDNIRLILSRLNNELDRRARERRATAIDNFKTAFNALRAEGVRVYGVYDYSDQLTFNNFDDFYFD